MYYDNEADFLFHEVKDGIRFHGEEGALPTPPEGYYWQLDEGGLRMSIAPHCYRLWNNKLGYMPAAE
jgi:hypothetical protein